MSVTASTAADKIAALMISGNVSDRELADKTGIPRTTLARRMKRGDWLVLEIMLIADVMGVTPSEILPNSLGGWGQAGTR